MAKKKKARTKKKARGKKKAKKVAKKKPQKKNTRWRERDTGRLVSAKNLDARKVYRKELYDGNMFERATPYKRWKKEEVRARLLSLARVPAPEPDPSRFDVGGTVEKDIKGERNINRQIGNLIKKIPPGQDSFGIRIIHGGVVIRFQIIQGVSLDQLDNQIRSLLFQTARRLASERDIEIAKRGRRNEYTDLLEIMDELVVEIDYITET